MHIAQTPQNCPDFRAADVDWNSHNRGVTPEFYAETVKREDGTEFEREFVTLRVAGDILTACSQPMDAQLKERFADQYAGWKSGTEATLRGTPLAKWPLLNSRQVSALEAVSVFTVEHLAQLPDGNIHHVVDGRALRDKAIVWLKRQADSALADENAQLRARLDALEKGQAPAPVNDKPKRAPMSQHQREEISARMKKRWANIPSTEAASVTDKSENPACGQEALPPVLPPV